MSTSKINKTKPLSVKALSLINKLKPLVNNEDLSKLSGLHTIEENIDSFNNLDNINNILLKNMYETEKEFEMRKILTLKIQILGNLYICTKPLDSLDHSEMGSNQVSSTYLRPSQ